MKRLLGAAAVAMALATPAYAGNVNYSSYSTPDSAGFNSVTTTADGASDTPYSYYTGPVVFTISTGTVTAYCVDLNHVLQGSGMYNTGILNYNGEGQAISLHDSWRIGNIAEIGAAALQFGDLGHQLIAVAAQAAIWNIAYGQDNPTYSTNGSIGADIATLLGDVFTGPERYAEALIPAGDGWNNQLMVTGLATSAPEPSTWLLGLTGFGFLAALGWKRKRTAQTARYAIEA